MTLHNPLAAENLTLRTAFAKYLMGYRPGDEGRSEHGDQALQLVADDDVEVKAP